MAEKGKTDQERSEKREQRVSLSESDFLSQLEGDVVQEALKSGLDLREYSKSIDVQLKQVEHDAVKDYIKEAKEIASLHTEITDCDQVLMRMEEMLAKFQADLGSISSEIQSLQEQSVEMNVRLKNRQALRGSLSQVVDDMVIPETMVNTIMMAQVTDRGFLEQLHELQHKITFLRQQEFMEAKACGDIQEVIENLRIKAVEKIREWLLLKINSFKKPLSNYQIPQNAMLKFRFYYEFLLGSHREVAREVKTEYLDTMSKMFFSYFKTYVNRLMRLQIDDVPSKEDLLGADDSNKAVGYFAIPKSQKHRATVFAMGTRANVVGQDLESPVIVPHAAQQNSQKFHFEWLFRSAGFSLVEHSCREFMFLTDFFMCQPAAAQELFVQVMGKATAVVNKCIDDYCATSWDAISLFLCIQLVYRFKAICHKRNINALDQKLKMMENSLWPRFEQVMNMHVESVRTAEIERLGTVDTRPHYITRRYAELTSGLLGTCVLPQSSVSSFSSSGATGGGGGGVSGGSAAGGGEGSGNLSSGNHHNPQQDGGSNNNKEFYGQGLERLQPILTRMQSEMEQFLAKLTGSLVKGGRKHQLISLINNYDLILSVFGERGLDETREAAVVRELLTSQIEGYVEELLFPHFGALINFVNQTGPLVEQQHFELLKRYKEKVPNLVRSFGETWKTAIEDINKEVLTSFTNFKNGTNILQSALTQLVQYYHRFHQILGHSAFSDCPARNNLVNIHHIMVELRKYKPTF